VGNGEIDWSRVRRVLVVRLRSIGDTVLSTPSLVELKRFLPDARVDILLEDWVAPILDGFVAVDDVLSVGSSNSARFNAARRLRGNKYDVAINLHGGTTATFFTFASGARHRIGFRNYQYAFFHNIRVGSPAEYWGRERVHSVEQQLALLGSVGVPVRKDVRTSLAITPGAVESLEQKVSARSAQSLSQIGPLALIHPAAAFATKQWSVENFARTVEFLSSKGLSPVAIAAKAERGLLNELQTRTKVPLLTFDDLELPEITALTSKARLFVGNDSGIAHIAAAVGTPSVVVFGSSNRDHWRPWTDAPNEIVFNEFPCQPCPGHECKEFGKPRCILGVTSEQVFEAIERVVR
jgi:lipopolysaccharide heptosyltransferase II